MPIDPVKDKADLNLWIIGLEKALQKAEWGVMSVVEVQAGQRLLAKAQADLNTPSKWAAFCDWWNKLGETP